MVRAVDISKYKEYCELNLSKCLVHVITAKEIIFPESVVTLPSQKFP